MKISKCSNSSDVTVIILTFNEKIHIKRCILSLQSLGCRIVVIDSFSNDETCKLADSLGVEVLQNPFETHAAQINWAIDNANITTAWVFRLDADEYITEDLAKLLRKKIQECNAKTAGFTINLRRIFMGRWLRHGSLYPIHILRIWRSGKGRCEERFMDEHMIVQGHIEHINADFVDHNLNNLSWWTDKHNKYASREAVDLLNLEYGFMQSDSMASLRYGKQARLKRWLKVRVYARLPTGFRAFAYFLYRYFLRLGFLDGREGTTFHFLQGFWYRYLVDAKVDEVHRYARENNVSVNIAIERILGIKV
jgi:glycosyltransferase involved in cell wall biosynthesis